jgi:hypothetical protein
MYVLVDSLSEKQKEAILVDFARKEQALPVLPILPQTPPSSGTVAVYHHTVPIET